MGLDPCIDLKRVSAAYRRFCLACWIASALITAGFGFMVIFVAGNRSPVLSYGSQGDLWVDHQVVHSGETVNLYFGRTTWLRLCRSDFAAHVQISGPQGRSVRFDLPVHHIVPPTHGGMISPPKSREVKMPLFGDGVVGPAKLWADVSSYCWPPDWWWPITTTTPEVDFVVE